MTTKQVDPTPSSAPPVVDPNQLPRDLKAQLKFSVPTDEDMNVIAGMRSTSHPWKDRGETTAEALEALTKLRPFAQVSKLAGQAVGYFTVERDGPVPGAAYLRNIVVKQELRSKGVGAVMMDKALDVAREMNRKSLALRVDPSSPSVSFYRKQGFTTVATVVSKKSGKLRLLMSREL